MRQCLYPSRITNPNLEPIGIEHCREAGAVFGQCSGADGGGDHLLAFADFHLRLAEEIDHRAVAGIMQLVAVHANAVDRRHKAQVFDRAARSSVFQA